MTNVKAMKPMDNELEGGRSILRCVQITMALACLTKIPFFASLLWKSSLAVSKLLIAVFQSAPSINLLV